LPAVIDEKVFSPQIQHLQLKTFFIARVQGSEVQGSAQPPAWKAASFVGRETSSGAPKHPQVAEAIIGL